MPNRESTTSANRYSRALDGFLVIAGLAALLLLTQSCGSSGGSSKTPPPPPPTAGANVNESQETVSLYVDGTAGSDSNNGSKSSPFKTINKALSVAADRKST